MLELRGLPVVNELTERFSSVIQQLKQKDIVPKLSIVRIGEREDDLAYERGIIKRFSAVQAIAEVIALPLDCPQEKLEETIIALNEDNNVHGILLFRPLPKHLSEDNIKSIIKKEKDVDCMGLNNMVQVFSGEKNCYPPCTPQAVIEILDFYKIDVTGKRVTIVGRSLVVGKPLSMLLLGKNATVTICHTKTENLADECKKADILIACAGVAKMVKESFVNQDQIVIDVGINVDNGKLCGDVDYEHVANLVSAITPVPGGVGTVTTSVLLKHTIQSAVDKVKDLF
ncbi:bifunctional 5,10-methylenetetrahydrofolate dehydrogenase/5,10-methenyltetrahydrofolate cyclohydrolase [Acetivibrio cellulolyticus]|uniref:bifunctional 5,10-methylenetetrahydrofolate dehydrogenase/5,10-methenyltetrahydrofolate cyclohydrolase n=1 Tax=Acetivibrio cellulolyticus TaxID=35830 RepID=UPI0001E2EB60|nr:bifunctional 5,10-methylenetetrahydrofolate dehydrogenase/5,10-methenyltetrahydrofolate cyclohydrolase [Acetivibrio cellulolyticus]